LAGRDDQNMQSQGGDDHASEHDGERWQLRDRDLGEEEGAAPEDREDDQQYPVAAGHDAGLRQSALSNGQEITPRPTGFAERKRPVKFARYPIVAAPDFARWPSRKVRMVNSMCCSISVSVG